MRCGHKREREKQRSRSKAVCGSPVVAVLLLLLQHSKRIESGIRKGRWSERKKEREREKKKKRAPANVKATTERHCN